MNFSQIKDLLSGETGQNMHRHVFVLAGEESWQQEALKDILAGHENDSLLLTDQPVEKIPSVEIKKAQSWLGKEKGVVIFDANNNFNPDSFAAISGIVVGGGLFFLLLPETERWGEIYASAFSQRLLKSIRNTSEIIVIDQVNNDFSFIPPGKIHGKPAESIPPFLTVDQKVAVETIEQQSLRESNEPVVLVSDRGRGKSAALGIAAARLLKAGIKHIAITAPRLRTTDIFFKHVSGILPEAESTRTSVKLGDSRIQFYSPDQLMQENINADVLMVDEAAAIPVPILASFLEKYPQCIYATTVHGYEGTGRGFALRFNKILNEKMPNWHNCQMQTPIRWAENDPLEKWMFDLLCLDAEIVATKEIAELDKDKLEFALIKHSDISENETLLKEIFSLLVLAHYRTQPGDLVRLLDDNSLSLYVTQYDKHILAVALVSHEGLFSEELSRKIYRGERRPQGHLLAQALTYHCGIEAAATLSYSRVMRIAVHPQFQGLGIGTGLLEFIIKNEKQAGHDAVGTSFGMNIPLLKFWQCSCFNTVRIGFKREQTSGEHAAIMLLALNQEGKDVYSEAKSRFDCQIPFWFDDVLKDLPYKIKNYFQIENKNTTELNSFERKDLQSYIEYSRNFELCIAALTKLVIFSEELIGQGTFPENFRRVLSEKVTMKNAWKEIAVKMKMSGQSEVRQLFHSAICYLDKLE